MTRTPRAGVATLLLICGPAIGACSARTVRHVSTPSSAESPPTSGSLGRWENVERLDAGTPVEAEFQTRTRRGRVRAVTGDLFTLDLGDGSGTVAVPRTEVRRVWVRRSGGPKWAALGAVIGAVVGYLAGGLIIGDKDAVHPGVRYHHIFLSPAGAAGGALAGLVPRRVLIYKAP